MKKYIKIYMIIFVLLLFCSFDHQILSGYFSGDIFNSFSDSLRRVKNISDNTLFLFTEDEIERSVAQAGGWQGEYPVLHATVNEIGGVKLSQPLTIAKKESNWNTFYRHVVIKLLDEYFRKLGEYSYPHITEVLGVYDGGYYYAWARGHDGFPWGELDIVDGEVVTVGVEIEEWSRFSILFYSAGFNMSNDTGDVDDGRTSKNIAVDSSKVTNWLLIPAQSWTRIDLDSRSANSNGKVLAEFLEQNDARLREQLGDCKFELLTLASKPLVALGPHDDRERINQLFSYYLQEMLKAGGYISQNP